MNTYKQTFILLLVIIYLTLILHIHSIGVQISFSNSLSNQLTTIVFVLDFLKFQELLNTYNSNKM